MPGGKYQHAHLTSALGTDLSRNCHKSTMNAREKHLKSVGWNFFGAGPIIQSEKDCSNAE
jgi:hypothetical protein